MSSMSVLLVDDEVSYLETLSKRLSKREAEVRVAHSGEEALEVLQDHAIDVVLIDVKMPGMDGLTALHKIKQQWPLTEVIVLTGHASMEAAIRGMELGAFDYLMKPVDFTELLYKLEDACSRKRAHEMKIIEKERATKDSS